MFPEKHLALAVLAACSAVLAENNIIPVNDGNFTNIHNNLGGYYQLTEDVYLNPSNHPVLTPQEHLVI